MDGGRRCLLGCGGGVLGGVGGGEADGPEAAEVAEAEAAGFVFGVELVEGGEGSWGDVGAGLSVADEAGGLGEEDGGVERHLTGGMLDEDGRVGDSAGESALVVAQESKLGVGGAVGGVAGAMADSADLGLVALGDGIGKGQGLSGAEVEGVGGASLGDGIGEVGTEQGEGLAHDLLAEGEEFGAGNRGGAWGGGRSRVGGGGRAAGGEEEGGEEEEEGGNGTHGKDGNHGINRGKRVYRGVIRDWAWAPRCFWRLPQTCSQSWKMEGSAMW